MPRVTLSKPIAPGWRRPVSLVPDEPVDQRDDGSFATAEPVEGDSTVSVNPNSTPTQINIWVNGDGSTGDKVIVVKADGHLGQGEVVISQEIGFTVSSPDATAFGVTEGLDEPIPTTRKK